MSAKLRCVLAVGVALLAVVFARAAEQLPAPGQLAAVFRPYRVDQIALSPNGRHLAYAVHESALLFVMIAELDRPDHKATIMIGENATGLTGRGLFQRRVMLTARVTS